MGKYPKQKIIDIALIQSLRKKGIVDECHHISARRFEIVARQCKAKYITGLSATVIRKDGYHPIILMNCGPIRYKDDPRRQARLRPSVHKVVARKTNFIVPSSVNSEENPPIHEIYSALISDQERNKMIIEDVTKMVQEKRFPLLLTELLGNGCYTAIVQSINVMKKLYSLLAADSLPLHCQYSLMGLSSMQ